MDVEAPPSNRGARGRPVRTAERCLQGLVSRSRSTYALDEVKILDADYPMVDKRRNDDQVRCHGSANIDTKLLIYGLFQKPEF